MSSANIVVKDGQEGRKTCMHALSVQKRGRRSALLCSEADADVHSDAAGTNARVMVHH